MKFFALSILILNIFIIYLAQSVPLRKATNIFVKDENVALVPIQRTNENLRDKTLKTEIIGNPIKKFRLSGTNKILLMISQSDIDNVTPAEASNLDESNENSTLDGSEVDSGSLGMSSTENAETNFDENTEDLNLSGSEVDSSSIDASTSENIESINLDEPNENSNGSAAENTETVLDENTEDSTLSGSEVDSSSIDASTSENIESPNLDESNGNSALNSDEADYGSRDSENIEAMNLDELDENSSSNGSEVNSGSLDLSTTKNAETNLDENTEDSTSSGPDVDSSSIDASASENMDENSNSNGSEVDSGSLDLSTTKSAETNLDENIGDSTLNGPETDSPTDVSESKNLDKSNENSALNSLDADSAPIDVSASENTSEKLELAEKIVKEIESEMNNPARSNSTFEADMTNQISGLESEVSKLDEELEEKRAHSLNPVIEEITQYHKKSDDLDECSVEAVLKRNQPSTLQTLEPEIAPVEEAESDEEAIIQEEEEEITGEAEIIESDIEEGGPETEEKIVEEAVTEEEAAEEGVAEEEAVEEGVKEEEAVKEGAAEEVPATIPTEAESVINEEEEILNIEESGIQNEANVANETSIPENFEPIEVPPPQDEPVISTAPGESLVSPDETNSTKIFYCPNRDCDEFAVVNNEEDDGELGYPGENAPNQTRGINEAQVTPAEEGQDNVTSFLQIRTGRKSSKRNQDDALVFLAKHYRKERI